MPIPIDAALPPAAVLSDGDVIRVTAIDPVTGNTVAGVTVSSVSIWKRDGGGGASLLAAFPNPLLLPKV